MDDVMDFDLILIMKMMTEYYYLDALCLVLP